MLQIRVALHPCAEDLIRGVVLQLGFEFRHVCATSNSRMTRLNSPFPSNRSERGAGKFFPRRLLPSLGRQACLRFLVWRRNCFERRAWVFLLESFSLHARPDVFPLPLIILQGVSAVSVPSPPKKSQDGANYTNVQANAGYLANSSADGFNHCVSEPLPSIQASRDWLHFHIVCGSGEV